LSQYEHLTSILDITYYLLSDFARQNACYLSDLFWYQ